MANQDRFFNKLKKLFSKQAIVRVDDKGHRKVVDTDERQMNTNMVSLKDRYTRLQTSFYEQQGSAQSMAYQQVRRELFRDYDAMDNDAILSSALDIYADEATTHDEYGRVLQVKSSNEDIKDHLHNLFYDVLNIEFNLWPWIRNLCKYGDFFLGLEIAEKEGIVNALPYSVYDTQRVEGSDPNNINYVKFHVDNDAMGKKEYENYEMAHFRLLSDTNFLPYGKGMMENARRVWKQLSLMEDAMLIHRIMRAPEKRVFRIDIGNIPPNEVDNYMQKIINKMKKVPFVDQRTGEYNLKYNMQNLTEDFFLPVRGGDSGTEIDSLSGLQYAAIEDIDYLKDKMFAALKIPRAYLSYEEDLSGKATLAAEDVRFARTIERIQRTVVSELTKIAVVHLYSIGVTDSEMVNFELSLTNPSTIYEQEKINLWNEKVRLADDIKNLRMLSTEWIYNNILNISEHEQTRERAKVVQDMKDMYRHEQIERDGEDPANPQPQMESEQHMNNEGKDKGGRPPEGKKYDTDDHHYGRDPLGDEERKEDRKRDRRDDYVANKNAKRRAREHRNKLKRELNQKKQMISDNKKHNNSMLDEDNLLDDTKN